MKRSAILVAVLSLFFAVQAVRAEIDAAVRSRIYAMQLELRKASQLFVGGNFEKSGDAIAKIQDELQKIAKDGDAETIKALKPLHAALGRAHAALKVKGVAVPKLEPLGKASASPDKPEPKPAPGGAVSFTKQVAPILVAKCGNCHVRNARGMFSMADYEALMRGNNDGKVVFAGDALNSRIIEVIDSGDMPRGGLKINNAERETLEKWINEGAKFDGDDPGANLSSLAPNVNSDLPKVELAQATGKETISFASDIAPILNEHCANCHGNGRRPSGRFNLTTITAMLRGGESGPAVLPGKPQESLLYQKITDPPSGQRMPLRQPALDDDKIAKIRTWIAEGATFDGPDPGQHIRQVAALAKAKAATHEELLADRMQWAQQNWKLGMANIEGYTAETDNFFVIGNQGEATVEEFARNAERLVPQVAELFGAPSDKPLFKGRMTLFLFKQRYDYSEFGKMVEKRELPRVWRGHWEFNIVDAYGAMIPPRADEYSFNALAIEQIAGAYVASLGNPPDWFSQGAGRVAASRLAGDDPRVASWDGELPEVWKAMQKSDDFMQGKLPPDAAAVASYSFVKFLMGRDPARFQKLLTDLRSGRDFGEAFGAIYGGSPQQISLAWARSASRKIRR